MQGLSESHCRPTKLAPQDSRPIAPQRFSHQQSRSHHQGAVPPPHETHHTTHTAHHEIPCPTTHYISTTTKCVGAQSITQPHTAGHHTTTPRHAACSNPLPQPNALRHNRIRTTHYQSCCGTTTFTHHNQTTSRAHERATQHTNTNHIATQGITDHTLRNMLLHNASHTACSARPHHTTTCMLRSQRVIACSTRDLATHTLRCVATQQDSTGQQATRTGTTRRNNAA